jgi:hypothetical protein
MNILYLISNTINYTVWGFWITVAGTSLSIISLLITGFVKLETKSIRQSIHSDLIKHEIRKAKESILKDILASIKLISEDDTIDYVFIKSTLNSVNLYEVALSQKSKRVIKIIENRLGLFNIIPIKRIGKFLFRNTIAVRLDQLYKRIESEIDQKEEYVRRLK